MASTKKNEAKIDRAFAVVERLENNEKIRNEAVGDDALGTEKKQTKRSGLQFRFSMDALISDKDTEDAKQGDIHSGESNLLNFNFTIPYVWRIPIVGKTALKLIKRFQGKEYPESIKDILSSLKKKRPL